VLARRPHISALFQEDHTPLEVRIVEVVPEHGVVERSRLSVPETKNRLAAAARRYVKVASNVDQLHTTTTHG
jgi:hypothetical protein